MIMTATKIYDGRDIPGCYVTGDWTATTNGAPTTTKPWSCGSPCQSWPGNSPAPWPVNHQPAMGTTTTTAALASRTGSLNYFVNRL